MTSRKRISKTSWPWGRMSPAQRLRDLKAMADRSRAEIPIVKDQAAEAIRRIELNIVAIEEQMAVAGRFLEEEVRAENKAIAYELSLLGIDLIDSVNASQDQRSLNAELRDRLDQARDDAAASPEDTDDLDGFFTS